MHYSFLGDYFERPFEFSILFHWFVNFVKHLRISPLSHQNDCKVKMTEFFSVFYCSLINLFGHAYLGSFPSFLYLLVHISQFSFFVHRILCTNASKVETSLNSVTVCFTSYIPQDTWSSGFLLPKVTLFPFAIPAVTTTILVVAYLGYCSEILDFTFFWRRLFNIKGYNSWWGMKSV